MSAAPRRPECDIQAFLSRRPYVTVYQREYYVAAFIFLTAFLQIQGFVTFDSKYWPDSDGGLIGTYESATPVSAKLEQKDWIFDSSQYQAEVSCSYSRFL